MKAMMLAAGEGTRLRPFTLQLPKPAIPFLGVPLVDYSLHLLQEVGCDSFVVNHCHLSTEIIRLFQRPSLAGRRVAFSDERSGLLGSGGAIHKAKEHFEAEKNFIVVNADELIFPHSSDQLLQAKLEHEKSGRLATLIVTDHAEVGTKFGGVWCDRQQVVQAFSKQPIGQFKGWHYIGLLYLSNRVFKYFKNTIVEENLLYETLTQAMSRGEKVAVHPIQAEWFESGNPADFKLATERCLDALIQGHEPWALGLLQFLIRQSLTSPLIEESDTLLIHRLRSTFQNLGLILPN